MSALVRELALELYTKGYRADHIEAIKEKYDFSHTLAVEICDMLSDMEAKE